MSYLAVWKVLEEMIIDFRKRGIAVPTNVVQDLKYAKTLVNVLKTDFSQIETSKRIDEYLQNVELYLISKAQEKLGNEYVDKWLKRLDEATKKTIDGENEAVRFVHGVPREQHWIRIIPSKELSFEMLKALAEEQNLALEVQKDGCLLVHGEDDNVKDFVKKIATKYGLKTRK